MMKPFDEPIYVTRPLLPPLEALNRRLAEIWSARWLTNAGEQHEQLGRAIREYLDVAEVSLFNNGTIALLAAVRALGMVGEVITTPFTFPATPHAISWSGATPVFCDIDPVTMNIDPTKIEALITPKTTGILAVHVYGIPCDVAALQALADRYGLKLVYDAAHAFGTRIDGVGIGTFGDASMFSFHATKLFHSAEGGALTCGSRTSREAFDHLKNFGILNQEEVGEVGINGKMNELQAALGLAVVECVPAELRCRQAIIARYRARLEGMVGVALMPEPPGVESSGQLSSHGSIPRRSAARATSCSTVSAAYVLARSISIPSAPITPVTGIYPRRRPACCRLRPTSRARFCACRSTGPSRWRRSTPSAT